MQINSVNPLLHNISEHASQKDSLSVDSSSSKIKDNKTGTGFDLHNMSFGDMNYYLV